MEKKIWMMYLILEYQRWCGMAIWIKKNDEGYKLNMFIIIHWFSNDEIIIKEESELKI